jgi:hypothetical protein
MSATPPEAKAKYSRAPGDPERHSGASAELIRTGSGVAAVVFGCGLFGAALLVASEFAQLYSVHTPIRRAALQTVTGGAHNAYAFVPIAILALFLAWGAVRARSGPALLALGLLGVISLVIALAGDLPDAQASGLVAEAGRYVTASSSPSAGIYLETLGGVMLLITSVTGLLLGGPPARRPPRATHRPLASDSVAQRNMSAS